MTRAHVAAALLFTLLLHCEDGGAPTTAMSPAKCRAQNADFNATVNEGCDIASGDLNAETAELLTLRLINNRHVFTVKAGASGTIDVEQTYDAAGLIVINGKNCAAPGATLSVTKITVNGTTARMDGTLTYSHTPNCDTGATTAVSVTSKFEEARIGVIGTAKPR